MCTHRIGCFQQTSIRVQIDQDRIGLQLLCLLHTMLEEETGCMVDLLFDRNRINKRIRSIFPFNLAYKSQEK